MEKRRSVCKVFFLVNDENAETPPDGVKVKIPLKSVAVASVTHLEFLSLLEEIETITGICNPKLVCNAAVQQNFSEGKITDLGDSFSINVENDDSETQRTNDKWI